jgi:hypothetical protein
MSSTKGNFIPAVQNIKFSKKEQDGYNITHSFYEQQLALETADLNRPFRVMDKIPITNLGEKILIPIIASNVPRGLITAFRVMLGKLHIGLDPAYDIQSPINTARIQSAMSKIRDTTGINITSYENLLNLSDDQINQIDKANYSRIIKDSFNAPEESFIPSRMPSGGKVGFAHPPLGGKAEPIGIMKREFKPYTTKELKSYTLKDDIQSAIRGIGGSYDETDKVPKLKNILTTLNESL